MLSHILNIKPQLPREKKNEKSINNDEGKRKNVLVGLVLDARHVMQVVVIRSVAGKMHKTKDKGLEHGVSIGSCIKTKTYKIGLWALSLSTS